LISSIRPGLLNGAWGKFEHGVRGNACRQPPRIYVTSNLSYAKITVEVDQIDGETHANRMHGLARQNPKPFPGQQGITSQQSFPACRTVVG
jgi:hypothetical protein